MFHGVACDVHISIIQRVTKTKWKTFKVPLGKFWQNETKFGDVVCFPTSPPQRVGMKEEQQVFEVPILMLENGFLPNFTFSIK